MTRHIGERMLARFDQGDLSTRRSVRIRAHLTGCARCRELNDDLAGVTTLLADMQTPPMPEHLSARIQTALAAEATRRAGETAAARSAGTETDGAAAPTSRPSARAPRHERREAHGRRRPRAFRLSSPVALRTMAAAAAAVVIAGGGYELVAHGGGSGASSSTPSGSTTSGPASNNPVLAPLSTAAAQLHYEYAGQRYSIIAVASGTNYAPATISGQVSRELRRNRRESSLPASGGALHRSTAQGTARSAAKVGGVPLSRLQGCVTGLVRDQQILLVEVAKYQGKSATVIVTRASASAPEQVWVVGTGCSATRSDLFTHVSLAAAG
jgi:hypothetical protein